MQIRYIVLLISVILLASCKKDAPIPSFGEMEACHNSSNWTLSQLQGKLTGTWDAVRMECPMTGSITVPDAYVKFYANGNVEYYENDSLLMISQYQLTESVSGVFSIVTSPDMYMIGGQFRVCGDYRGFYNSFVDGCDITYKQR